MVPNSHGVVREWSPHEQVANYYMRSLMRVAVISNRKQPATLDRVSIVVLSEEEQGGKRPARV